jgi:hypothetical protein
MLPAGKFYVGLNPLAGAKQLGVVSMNFFQRSCGCLLTSILRSHLSRAAHRDIYSFFTALRAPSFIHIYTKTHHIPLPQLVQAVTSPESENIRRMLDAQCYVLYSAVPSQADEQFANITSNLHGGKEG